MGKKASNGSKTDPHPTTTLSFSAATPSTPANTTTTASCNNNNNYNNQATTTRVDSFTSYHQKEHDNNGYNRLYDTKHGIHTEPTLPLSPPVNKNFTNSLSQRGNTTHPNTGSKTFSPCHIVTDASSTLPHLSSPSSFCPSQSSMSIPRPPSNYSSPKSSPVSAGLGVSPRITDQHPNNYNNNQPPISLSTAPSTAPSTNNVTAPLDNNSSHTNSTSTPFDTVDTVTASNTVNNSITNTAQTFSPSLLSPKNSILWTAAGNTSEFEHAAPATNFGINNNNKNNNNNNNNNNSDKDVKDGGDYSTPTTMPVHHNTNSNHNLTATVNTSSLSERAEQHRRNDRTRPSKNNTLISVQPGATHPEHYHPYPTGRRQTRSERQQQPQPEQQQKTPQQNNCETKRNIIETPTTTSANNASEDGEFNDTRKNTLGGPDCGDLDLDPTPFSDAENTEPDFMDETSESNEDPQNSDMNALSKEERNSEIDAKVESKVDAISGDTFGSSSPRRSRRRNGAQPQANVTDDPDDTDMDKTPDNTSTITNNDDKNAADGDPNNEVGKEKNLDGKDLGAESRTSAIPDDDGDISKTSSSTSTRGEMSVDSPPPPPPPPSSTPPPLPPTDPSPPPPLPPPPPPSSITTPSTPGSSALPIIPTPSQSFSTPTFPTPLPTPSPCTTSSFLSIPLSSSSFSSSTPSPQGSGISPGIITNQIANGLSQSMPVAPSTSEATPFYDKTFPANPTMAPVDTDDTVTTTDDTNKNNNTSATKNNTNNTRPFISTAMITAAATKTPPNDENKNTFPDKTLASESQDSANKNDFDDRESSMKIELSTPKTDVTKTTDPKDIANRKNNSDDSSASIGIEPVTPKTASEAHSVIDPQDFANKTNNLDNHGASVAHVSDSKNFADKNKKNDNCGASIGIEPPIPKTTAVARIDTKTVNDEIVSGKADNDEDIKAGGAPPHPYVKVSGFNKDTSTTSSVSATPTPHTSPADHTTPVNSAAKTSSSCPQGATSCPCSCGQVTTPTSPSPLCPSLAAAVTAPFVFGPAPCCFPSFLPPPPPSSLHAPSSSFPTSSSFSPSYSSSSVANSTTLSPSTISSSSSCISSSCSNSSPPPPVSTLQLPVVPHPPGLLSPLPPPHPPLGCSPLPPHHLPLPLPLLPLPIPMPLPSQIITASNGGTAAHTQGGSVTGGAKHHHPHHHHPYHSTTTATAAAAEHRHHHHHAHPNSTASIRITSSSCAISSSGINNNNTPPTTSTLSSQKRNNTGLVGTVVSADALYTKRIQDTGSAPTSPLAHHCGTTSTVHLNNINTKITNNQLSASSYSGSISSGSLLTATTKSTVDCTLKSTTTTNLTSANMERRSTVPGGPTVVAPAATVVTSKTNTSKRSGSNRGSAGYTSVTCTMEGAEEYLKPIYQDGQVILEVECGQNKALMYLSKLCQGSKGPCIYFQGSWLTPNEFQYVSGRESAKDWKRSIRHHGKSMKLLLSRGILTVHSAVCDCEGCRISSPVNRCRLAEKRVDSSPMRDDRCLTGGLVEWKAEENMCNSKSPSICQKSCDDSDNSNDLDRKSLKRCSPLRESRLNNIIDQLRTTREKEGLPSSDEDDRIKLKKCSDLPLTNGHSESSENVNGLSPNHKSGSFENRVNDENQSLTNGNHEPAAILNRANSLPEDVSGKRAKLELEAIEKDAITEDMGESKDMSSSPNSKKCVADDTSKSQDGDAHHASEIEKSDAGSDAEAADDDDEVDVCSNDDEDDATDASTRLKQEELTDDDTKRLEKEKLRCSPKVEPSDPTDSKPIVSSADECPASLRDDECKSSGVDECEACDAALKLKAEANTKSAMMVTTGAEDGKIVKEECDVKKSPVTTREATTESGEEMSDIAQKIYREVSEQKRCQDTNHLNPQRNIAEEIYRECRESKTLDSSSLNNNNNNQSHNNNHKDVKLSPSAIYSGKHVSPPPRNIAEEIYLQTKSESLLRDCKGDCKKEVCCNLACKDSSPYARNIAQEIYREGHEKRQTEENLMNHHRKIAQDMYREHKGDADSYHHHSHSQHLSPKDGRRDIAQEIYREVRGDHVHQNKATTYAHKNNSSVDPSNKDRHRDHSSSGQRDLSGIKVEKQRDSISSSKESHNQHHHHHHHSKDRQRDGSKDKHSSAESSPKIKTNGIDGKEDKRSRSSSPSREAKEKEKENGKYSDFMRLLAASHLQPKMLPHMNGYEQYLHRFRPEAAAAALHPGFSPLLQNCMLYGHPAFVQREPCFFSPQALQLASLQGLQGQFLSPFVYPPRIPVEAPRMLELFRPMPYMQENLLTQCTTPTPSAATSPTSHCSPSTTHSGHTASTTSSSSPSTNTSSSSSSSSTTISSSGAHKRSASSDLDTALDLSTKRIKLEYHNHHHPSGFRLNGSSSSSGSSSLSNGKDKKLSNSISSSKTSPISLNGVNMAGLNGNISNKLDTPKSMKHSHSEALLAKAYTHADLSHGCTCTFKKGIVPRYIHQWTVNEVCQFIAQLDGCSEYTEVFQDNQVTGKMLLALNREHLMSGLGMKIAAALLLTEAVAMQQKKETAYGMCNYCQLTAKEVIVSS